MNKLSIFTLKALRKVYTKVFRVDQSAKPECEQDPDKASQIIYDALMDEKPCMIARFGSTELATMVNYLGVKHPNKSICKFIKGESLPWWWNKNIISQMQQWSGFFPPTKEKIEMFCELMLSDMKEVDILGSWLSAEKYFESELESTRKIRLMYLDPYWTKQPWTKALENKHILVVHPFAETIMKQYEKREFLFENKDVLPRFASLQMIKAVQSIGGESNSFQDWFEALEYMKNEIEKHDFDICLIGAGAYGFPLAAHVKRMGKKAVHVGGSLQLLFGIKGKRWENTDYGVSAWGVPRGFYSQMMNENWVKPSESEKPESANKVEGACYW